LEGFQAAYRVPRNRNFFRQTAVAVMLVVLSAVPLVGASLLLLFGGQVENTVLNWMKVDPLRLVGLAILQTMRDTPV
jgi:membrane protein